MGINVSFRSQYKDVVLARNNLYCSVFVQVGKTDRLDLDFGLTGNAMEADEAILVLGRFVSHASGKQPKSL